jgi:UDP-N-acetyl-D-galactosamine dehydrogenase
VDIIKEFEDYGAKVFVMDLLASSKEAHEEYGIRLLQEKNIPKVDAIVLAVSHKSYKQKSPQDFLEFYKKSKDLPLMMDLKGVLKDSKSRFDYWSL